MEAIVSTKHDIYHRYRFRSCTNCDKWLTCSHGKNRPLVCKANYSRFGCESYVGIYSTEKPMNGGNQKRKYLGKDNYYQNNK